MNWKWYIPVVIVALTFFGVNLERSTLPNQEIVVQFNTENVSAFEAEQAIANVTFQLKSIGVENVLVSAIENGKLKVSYYSAKDVATIKGLFSAKNSLSAAAFNEKDNSSKIPFSPESHIYKLDVVTIQQDYNAGLGLQGLPVGVKTVKEQYLKPIISMGFSEISFQFSPKDEIVAYKNYRHASHLIDHTSYKIPEVRAGPLA